MIFSPTRFEDMKFRQQLLDDIEWMVSTGKLELAKNVMMLSATMKQRIETHDYSREDAWLEQERKLIGNQNQTHE